MLSEAQTDLTARGSPARCRDVVGQLGRAGEKYRSAVYAGVSGQRRSLHTQDVANLLSSPRTHLEDTVRASARPDGLFHSYSTLAFIGDGVSVHRLAPMLEGQVAVLGSGMLDTDGAVSLLRALRQSALYRADQHSYQLYPDVEIPTFFGRNTWPPQWARDCALLSLLHQAGERGLVVRDSLGGWHFGSDIRHAGDVSAELDRLAVDPRFSAAVTRDRAAVLEAFEEIFDHRSFTGRSSRFFAFEGWAASTGTWCPSCYWECSVRRWPTRQAQASFWRPTRTSVTGWATAKTRRPTAPSRLTRTRTPRPVEVPASRG